MGISVNLEPFPKSQRGNFCMHGHSSFPGTQSNTECERGAALKIILSYSLKVIVGGY